VVVLSHQGGSASQTSEREETPVKKPLIILALGIAAVAALTGCAASAPAAPGSVSGDEWVVSTNSVDTPAGAVDCTFYQGYKAGAVQCDWANLGKATAPVAVNVGEGSVGVVQQTVSGKRVDCVVFNSYKSGGLSCNFPSVQK